jgi:hypothetical protein
MVWNERLRAWVYPQVIIQYSSFLAYIAELVGALRSIDTIETRESPQRPKSTYELEERGNLALHRSDIGTSYLGQRHSRLGEKA